jgi:type IV pilus assembly protein PilC
MPVFNYTALDPQGVEVKDEIEALSEKEAISKIRNLGYFPTKVRSMAAAKAAAVKAAAKPKRRPGAGGRVKVKYVTEFARQLSTLQDAGLPILRSLRILQEQQRSGTFKRIIGYVGDDIEGGSTLSEAMSRYPRAFNRLFVNMVAAGETGGVLDLILARISDFMESDQKLKSRVKGAMIYPAVVLSAAFCIVLLLMWKVIPTFSTVLVEMSEGEALPKLTQVVLGVSDWIAKGPKWFPTVPIPFVDFKIKIGGWAVMIAMPFLIVFMLRTARRFRVGRLILDTIKLKLPIVGQLVGKVSVTRWTRTLGTLIGAGVPILDAINVTRETAGNEVYANMLNRVQKSIRQGDTFAGPLKQSKTVDLIVSNMVAVGEETGDLDKMLLKVADNFDEQVEVMVGSLMHLLEPVIIVVLGSVVMLIVLSVFLPMIQVITTLGAGA